MDSSEDTGCRTCRRLDHTLGGASRRTLEASTRRETNPEGRPGREPLVRTAVFAGVLLTVGLLTEHALHSSAYRFVEYLIFFAAYLLVGGKVIRSAVINLVHGRVFDETFLMTIATLGAVLIHQLPEAVAVMLFYSVGELVQDAAMGRSRRAIGALLDIRPDTANVRTRDGIEAVRPEDVHVGDIVQVRPGERVPLDGEVVEGQSFVDASALTGESIPVRVSPGEKVLAGMVNGEGAFDLRVQRPSSQSAVSRILDLVEKAAARKARTEQVITRLARYYTPAVMVAALGIAVVPPALVPGAPLGTWVYRALVLLVISCPCALVISIPLGYFGGIGSASRHGILVKGANSLDALTSLHTVVFDKTGTLTKGVFRVTSVSARNGYTGKDVLEFAALAEANSAHPIARSIMEAYGRHVEAGTIQDYREIPGHGVRAVVDGKEIIAGNDRLMHREMIEHDSCDLKGTVVYVAVNRIFAGYIAISDELRSDAPAAVAGLRRLGVKKVVMLTGDDEAAAKAVADSVGMDGYFARLLPEEKVAKLEEFESEASRGRNARSIAFVGDGINDAPVITRATVGVAMGGLGRDAAIEAADVVIMNDEPSRLVLAIRIARTTRAVIMQNIVMSLALKVAFVALGAAGIATMWEAVFADVGVALAAIVNAARVLRREYDGGALSPARSSAGT